MIKAFMLFLVICFYQSTLFAKEIFLDLGYGNTSNNIEENSLYDGEFSSIDVYDFGHVTWFKLGIHYSPRFYASIDMSKFEDVLNFKNNIMTNQISYLGVSIFYDFLQTERYLVAGSIGYGQWKSEINSSLTFLSEDGRLFQNITDSKKFSGHTPKVGLSVLYSVSDNLSIGLEYSHYFNLGKPVPTFLVDLDLWAIGDLGNAVKGQEELELNLDVFSVFIRFSFN